MPTRRSPPNPDRMGFGELPGGRTHPVATGTEALGRPQTSPRGSPHLPPSPRPSANSEWVPPRVRDPEVAPATSPHSLPAPTDLNPGSPAAASRTEVAGPLRPRVRKTPA